MEALEMTMDLQELAAWVQEEYYRTLRQGASYELEDNEFTAGTYAAENDMDHKKAYRMLDVLRRAGKLEARKELIDGKRQWVFTWPAVLDKLEKVG